MRIGHRGKAVAVACLLSMGLTWGAFAADAPPTHVILSYDVSGSLAERYMGPEMHRSIKAFVNAMLFDAAGPDFSLNPQARAGSSEDFAGFPLASDATQLSAFTFGNKVNMLFDRQPINKARVDGFFPTRFTDQNTRIDEAVEAACLRLFDPEQDPYAYWFYISDGKDDPGTASAKGGAAEALLKVEMSLVYTLSIPVPAGTYDPKALNGDPPEKAVVYVYRIARRTALAVPTQVTAESVLKPGAQQQLFVRWNPGEWSAEKHPPSGRLPEERAEEYRVESSADMQAWAPLGEVVKRGTYPYSIAIEGVTTGYVRVVARRGAQEGASNPTQVISGQVDVEAPTGISTSYDATTGVATVAWETPNAADSTVAVQYRFGDAEWTELAAAAASVEKSVRIDTLQPGTYRFRLRADRGGASSEYTESATSLSIPGKQAPPPAKPSGGGKAFVAILLLLLILAGAGYWFFALRKTEVTFQLVRSDRTTARPFECALERNQRLLFGKGGGDNDIVWSEVEAPDYFLKNAWGSVRLCAGEAMEGSSTGQAEQLEDGQSFQIKDAHGNLVPLKFILVEDKEKTGAEEEMV